MSEPVTIWIIYGLVFIAILLGAWGALMLMQSASGQRRATDRRLKEEIDRFEVEAPVSLIHTDRTESDPVSARVLSLFPALAAYLAQTETKLAPRTLAAFAVGASVVLSVLLKLLTGVPLVAAFALGFVAGVGAPLVYIKFSVAAEKRKFAEQLPIAIDLVTRGLEAGHPVPVALGLVGREMDKPAGPAFKRANEEIQLGLDRTTALRRIARKYPEGGLRFFIATIEVQRETGGNLVSVLKNLTKVIREHEHMRRKAYAMSAEGRLTAFVVGGLPFILVIVLSVMNPGYYTEIMGHPLLLPIMAGAVSWWALGIVWIWKMVNISV